MGNLSLVKVKEEKFYDTNCEFYKSNYGEIYMTGEQLGEVLGYSYPRQAINKIVERNPELKEPEFSVEVKLTSTDGKTYMTRIFSEDGIYEVLFLSKQPLAREFRRFVREVLKELRQTGVVMLSKTEVTPLDALELMVETLRKQEQQMQQMQQMQVRQQKNINQLNHIVSVKDNTTLRQQFNHSIKALAYRLQQPIDKTYNDIYKIINNNLHINIEARARNRGISKIDVLEQENLLEYGLRIINQLFQEANQFE